MKIKNKDIDVAKEMLMQLELKGKISRFRSRFCRNLEEYQTTILKYDNIELGKQFAERDESGNIVYQDDLNDTFLIDASLINVYLKEKEEHDNEYFEIENSDSNKEMLLTVASLLLDDELIEVSGNGALVHDELCEEFESIVEFYNSKSE